MGVQMSVGMWRANENPNPCTDLNDILQAYPLSVQGSFFGAGLTPPPSAARDWGGLKPHKLKDTFL